MVQKSRIAPESYVRHVATRGGKAPRRPGRAVVRHVTVLVLVVGSVHAMPALFGPDFFHDRARDVMGFAAAAGGWVRTAVAVLFQSIPVR